MSHNTPLRNAEFRVTFVETNLRYVLGDIPLDPDKVARVRAQLEEAKKELELVKKNLS